MRFTQKTAVIAVDLEHTLPWPAQYESQVDRLPLDVAHLEAPARLDTHLRTEHGGVDVPANVAGILRRIAPFLDVEGSDWDRVIAVNVSPVHAVVSEPNAAPYTATKGGLEAMTRTLASELAPHGITAAADRLAGLGGRGHLPPRASEEACYTTGACLDVDGGYSMDGSLPDTAYS